MIQTHADVVERFRKALMEVHHHDWEMEMVAEAAHLCAAQLEHAHDGDDLLVVKRSSHRPEYIERRDLGHRDERSVWQFTGEGRPHSDNYDGP